MSVPKKNGETKYCYRVQVEQTLIQFYDIEVTGKEKIGGVIAKRMQDETCDGAITTDPEVVDIAYTGIVSPAVKKLPVKHLS